MARCQLTDKIEYIARREALPRDIRTHKLLRPRMPRARTGYDNRRRVCVFPTGAGHDKVGITAVKSKRDLRAFLGLPDQIFADDPNWIAPLRSEVGKLLTPGINPYFKHAEARYWLASRGGEPVGRISAQIDQLAIEREGRRIGHFGFIDAINDAAVFRGLFTTAEEWLKGQGMDCIQGPFNLSINEEAGLLVSGHDTPPYMMMGHARPYYAPRIEACGYSKAKDMFAYLLDITANFPSQIHKLINRALKRENIRLRRLDMKHYDRDLEVIINIFNDAWSDNWGFVPLTEAEARHTAKSMKQIIKPELVYIAEINGEPAGMMVTLPNLNQAISDLSGRLLPLGWAKLLWRLKVKGVSQVRVAMMGVKKQYQNSTLGAAIAFLLIETTRQKALAMGIREAELSWILEDNTGMRQMLRAINSKLYKTYRVYEKALP